MSAAAVEATDVVREGWPERRTGICSRCNERPVAVELIAQARTTLRVKPMKHYGTRARRVCEPCGQELYAAMLLAMEVEA